MTIRGVIPPEYQNVTDTNVGKMTEKEAIDLLSLVLRCTGEQNKDGQLCESCSYSTLCTSENYNTELGKALTMAIEALQFQQSVVRCGDCKLYQTSGSFCTLDGLFRDFEEYCSRGEGY